MLPSKTSQDVPGRMGLGTRTATDTALATKEDLPCPGRRSRALIEVPRQPGEASHNARPAVVADLGKSLGRGSRARIMKP